MVKIKLKKKTKTGVVYKLNCSCTKSYSGETKRNVNTRFKEHQWDIHNNANIVLSRHIQNKPLHRIMFDHFQILDTENNEHKRKFSEMLFIKKYENDILNLQTDINNLYSKYSQIIFLNDERF